MKKLTVIQKERKANFEAIETIKQEIKNLDYSEYRREIVQTAGHFTEESRKAYKEIKAKADANAGKIAEACEKLYTLEIKTRILAENARAALFAEAYPVIIEACKKYNGKPYGEKTREAIREEVKKHGYSFYFSGYDNGNINIFQLNENGYYSHGLEVEAIAVENGKYSRFLTPDNKLNIANVDAKPRAKYTENTTSEARKIAKAIRKYSEATKKIEEERRQLCDILPPGIAEPDYIKEYYIYF